VHVTVYVNYTDWKNITVYGDYVRGGWGCGNLGLSPWMQSRLRSANEHGTSQHSNNKPKRL